MIDTVDQFINLLTLLATTMCLEVTLSHKFIGKRYLDFPEKNFCCYCCDSAHGCGIVAPDWLVKANAIFLGSEKLEDGEYYVKWNAKGLQDNFFYHHDDEAKTPRRLV